MGQLFTEEAVDLLARGTQGLPRLLNQVGHLALSLAAENGVTVDVEVALEALETLGLSEDSPAVEPAPEEAQVPAEEPAFFPALEPGSAGIDPTVLRADGQTHLESEAPRLFMAPGPLG